MNVNPAELLKLGAKATLGLFFGLLLTILLVHFDHISLSTVPTWVWPSILIVACISGAVTFVNMASMAIDAFHEHRTKKQKLRTLEATRANSLAYLNTLNPAERKVLAYLVQNNERSVSAPLTTGSVLSLCKKGILAMTSGPQNILETISIVPDYVWKEIQIRRQDYIHPEVDQPFGDDEW
jgi:Super-infection exclusion protein B